MTVSVMVVLPECIVAKAPMKAGSAAAPVVTVHCEAAIPYSIGVSDGLVPGSHSYSLKSSAGETAGWGQRIGVGFSEPVTNEFTVVGPEPVAEEAADGSTITVTITY
jgi:hypothetical protein